MFADIPPFELQPRIVFNVFILSFVYVLMLSFSNLCLSVVEVTFYQVVRSLSIFFNIIFTYTLLGSSASIPAIFSCTIVVVGFFISSMGEAHFSWSGIFYGIASSVFVALYGIYVKKSLDVVRNNQWRLLHYNTVISTVIILPIMMVSGEWIEVLDRGAGNDNVWLWITMVVTGVAVFLINVAVFLQIKYTSALTNTVSGNAKTYAQTMLAAWYFQNPITVLNGMGIFISLCGSSLYSYVRYKETQRRK